MEASYSFF